MLIVLIIIAVLVLLFIILYFYYNNREIALRKESEAQRGVIESVHDTMWKIIQQKAEVSDKYRGVRENLPRTHRRTLFQRSREYDEVDYGRQSGFRHIALRRPDAVYRGGAHPFPECPTAYVGRTSPTRDTHRANAGQVLHLQQAKD